MNLSRERLRELAVSYKEKGFAPLDTKSWVQPFFLGNMAVCQLCLDPGVEHKQPMHTGQLMYHLNSKHGIRRPRAPPTGQSKKADSTQPDVKNMLEDQCALQEEKNIGVALAVVQCGIPYRAFRNRVFPAVSGLRMSDLTVKRKALERSDKMKEALAALLQRAHAVTVQLDSTQADNDCGSWFNFLVVVSGVSYYYRGIIHKGSLTGG